MSIKPVLRARTSSTYSSSSSLPFEGKYSPTLNSAMLPMATAIGKVFGGTMDNQLLTSSPTPRFDRPKAEECELYPFNEDRTLVDEADESDDIDSEVIHSLRKCAIEELSPTPGSQAMFEAFLAGYLPSSQDGPAHLYRDLRKTPHSPSSLPVPKMNAQSSVQSDSGLLPPLAPVVTASPRLKRTLSEHVLLSPESSGVILDAFSLLRKKHASSHLQSSFNASNGKKFRSRNDADLDSSQTSNPKKFHQSSVRTFGKRTRPKD